MMFWIWPKLESDTVVFGDESINLDQVCQEITESLSFQAEEKGLHVIGEHDDYSGIYVWSNAVHLKKNIDESVYKQYEVQ